MPNIINFHPLGEFAGNASGGGGSTLYVYLDGEKSTSTEKYSTHSNKEIYAAFKEGKTVLFFYDTEEDVMSRTSHPCMLIRTSSGSSDFVNSSFNEEYIQHEVYNILGNHVTKQLRSLYEFPYDIRVSVESNGELYAIYSNTVASRNKLNDITWDGTEITDHGFILQFTDADNNREFITQCYLDRSQWTDENHTLIYNFPLHDGAILRCVSNCVDDDDDIWTIDRSKVIPTPTAADYGKVLSYTAEGFKWVEQTGGTGGGTLSVPSAEGVVF